MPYSKKHKNPTISVILPLYKEPVNWIRESVTSILNQTYKDFELIIMLDNPKNEKALKAIEHYAKKDKRVRIIRNPTNIGLAATLNIGVKEAKGEYIARMDGDDVSLPERLEKELETARRKKKGIICSNRILMNEKGVEIGRSEYTSEDVKNLNKTLFTMDPHPITHPTIFAKRSLFLENPYDERFKNSQDFELWMRLIKKGVEFTLIEEPLLKFRVPKESYETRIKKNKNYTKYSLKALIKHSPHYWRSLSFIRSFFKFFFRKLVIEIVPTPVLIKIIKTKDEK